MKRPERQKDRQIEKDIERGRGSARLAPGAKLFDASDDSHVLRTTPLQTKVRELQGDPVYRTKLDAGIDPKREKSTTRKRMDKEVKPI